MQQRRLLRFVAGATACGAVASACSFSTGTSPGAAAETLIEGALGEQVGLSYVDAECIEPAANEVGESFTCTASTEAGDAVTFEGVVDPDDMIFVAASNIIAGEEMATVEAEAAQVLGDDIGVEIDPADVDCPDETTVLDAESQLRCEITDSVNGDRYVLVATFSDYELREGYGRRFYEVGEQLE